MGDDWKRKKMQEGYDEGEEEGGREGEEREEKGRKVLMILKNPKKGIERNSGGEEKGSGLG